MQYQLNNINSHPVAAKFYELMIEIEKLGAHPDQTALCNKCHELQHQTETWMNSNEYRKQFPADS